MTLLFFPITVITAYIADKKLISKAVSKRYRSGHHGVVIETEGSSDLEEMKKVHQNGVRNIWNAFILG